MKGLQYGEKPHIMDCMKNIKRVWDEKYSRNSIQHCWRKANILPVTWDSNINNSGGCVSLLEKMKIMSK